MHAARRGLRRGLRAGFSWALLAAVAVPFLLPFLWTTATLSEALPPRFTVAPDVAYVGLAVGAVIVAVGAVLSRFTVITSVPVLPAASVAVTVITLSPALREIPLMVHDVVPVAVPDPPVAAFCQVTLATARLSDALPPRLTVAPVVA